MLSINECVGRIKVPGVIWYYIIFSILGELRQQKIIPGTISRLSLRIKYNEATKQR